MIKLIGGFGIVASLVIGYKGQNTDFFILAGLIFIGICILEIPKILVKIVTAFAESLGNSLKEIKKNLESKNVE